MVTGRTLGASTGRVESFDGNGCRAGATGFGGAARAAVERTRRFTRGVGEADDPARRARIIVAQRLRPPAPAALRRIGMLHAKQRSANAAAAKTGRAEGPDISVLTTAS